MDEAVKVEEVIRKVESVLGGCEPADRDELAIPYANAVDLCQSALASSRNSAEAREILRAELSLHYRFQNRPGQLSAIRRLLKLDGLKPNEYRRLFGLIIELKPATVVDRYLSQLSKSRASSTNWAHVATMLWASKRVDDLFAWSERHPRGFVAAARLLTERAENSLQHREAEWGRAILCRLAEREPLDPGLMISSATLLLHHGYNSDAALISQRILSQRPSDPAGLELLRSTGASEVIAPKKPSHTDRAVPEQTAELLRSQALKLAISGDIAGAVYTLRRLRHVVELRINEVRRLIKGLEATGRKELLVRYLRVLRRSRPSKTNWPRVALIFWASGNIVDLLVWSARHPGGAAKATTLLRTLAENSIEHQEDKTASALLDQIITWSGPGSVDGIYSVKLYVRLGNSRRAFELAWDAANSRQNSDAAAQLLQEVAHLRLEAVAAELGPQTAASIAVELPLIQEVVGPNPLLTRLLETAKAWLDEVVARQANTPLGFDHEPRFGTRLRVRSVEPKGESAVGPADREFLGRTQVTVPSATDSHHYQFDESAYGAPDTRSGGALATSIPSQPDWQAIGAALEKVGDANTPKTLLQALKGIGSFVTDPGVRAQVAWAFTNLLRDQAGKALNNEEETLCDDLTNIVEQAGYLSDLLAQFFIDEGMPGRAIAVFLSQPADSKSSDEWLAAAALIKTRSEAMIKLTQRAVLSGGYNAARRASTFLLESGYIDEAVGIWFYCKDSYSETAAYLGSLRTLYLAKRKVEVARQAFIALESIAPFGPLTLADQKAVVGIARLIVTSAHESKTYIATTDLRPRFAESEPQSALAHFVDAMVNWSRLDSAAAHTCLQDGAGSVPDLTAAGVDFAYEQALIFARQHRYGDARRVLAQRSGLMAEEPANYSRALQTLRTVSAFCDGELYPECLIDLILKEVSKEPIGYTPRPNHLVTITSTLAQGGSERQAVNIIRAMDGDPRIARQTVLVRTTEGPKGFFLPDLKSTSAEIVVFGLTSDDDPDPVAVLPELTNRATLAKAIGMLPKSMRADVLRIARCLLDRQPAVVQIRQDFIGAAIACAIAGVPKFFCHRGSLSRNTWGYNELQAETLLRPMRHTYRRLMELTPFSIVNNSRVGLDTDRDWTAWPDTNKFRVVHNVVEFDTLGTGSPRNEDLRRQVGIPTDATLIGGVFRIAPVKRPRLWMEVAGAVLHRCPSAHFLIVGDGELGDEMRNFAESAGFSDRLHMPGMMADVAPWYRMMNMLLLTSEREGLPNVVIEAQHFGVPVVSANVGGADETLDDGKTGWTVPPDAGPDCFANMIMQSISDREWYAKAVSEAPSFVHKKFGARRAVETLISWYDFQLQPK